ncbi:uncharacterized protein LOC107766046 [Nicotiana tabacum]|uniref:Uncharacterized protein LOC107766046 n=1 Tax=Nicotiana tabacum TaxID=4097 RepID=A0A1S3XJZ8_TOBAC|nr:PREDICTED: uncharacterized protein LOC107766046 [Nicotiana tabacum]
MGYHHTRMQELCKEVDNLKGSMDAVTTSVSELRSSMDHKVAQAMEEIRKLLANDLTNHQEGPVENEGREMVVPRPRDGTHEDSKVKLASCKLERKALQWHQSYLKHRVARDWPRWSEYVACLYARFGSELFDDPMGDFKDLKQVSSVQDYVGLFDELLTRVELSEEYVVSCFVRGLKPEIGLPVKMLAPRNLA